MSVLISVFFPEQQQSESEKKPCSIREEASDKTTTAQGTQGLWIPLTLDKVIEAITYKCIRLLTIIKMSCRK